MRIARVFPTKTSMCPDDADAYFGLPDLFTPKYDEVHISCQFTWDINKAKALAYQWERYGKVKIGGVAIDGESDQPFKAGMYLRKGITITTRGCPNSCGFCQVRKGQFIEFDDFPVGNIVQDNNILASSDRHWRLVMAMLKKQHTINFSGGLEKYRITEKIAEDLRGLRIRALWLSCDQKEGIKPLSKAIKILHNAGFTDRQINVYVLIGDDFCENENRLKEVFRMGCYVFAQLFKDKDNKLKYSREFRILQRNWSRPAIYKKIMNGNKND